MSQYVETSIIYLAKLCDRHHDDEYYAFDNLEDAISQCQEWMNDEDYLRYVWIEPDWDLGETYAFFGETTCEDGPTVSVETIKFQKTVRQV